MFTYPDTCVETLDKYSRDDNERAILSHWLQLRPTRHGSKYESDARRILSDDNLFKRLRGATASETSGQSFFKEIFDIPFPPPAKPRFTFIDLFAGIGGIRLAYQQQSGLCVFSSEWNKDAAKSYFANFGEVPFGDITKIPSSTIPDFDILLAGFPCQPFSIIGAKEGFSHETQGTLFFEIERILRDKKPKAFMLENVRNLTAHDGGRTFRIILEHLRDVGYDVHYKVLNALHFGVPQKRERIIICGFRRKTSR